MTRVSTAQAVGVTNVTGTISGIISRQLENANWNVAGTLDLSTSAWSPYALVGPLFDENYTAIDDEGTLLTTVFDVETRYPKWNETSPSSSN